MSTILLLWNHLTPISWWGFAWYAQLTLTWSDWLTAIHLSITCTEGRYLTLNWYFALSWSWMWFCVTSLVAWQYSMLLLWCLSAVMTSWLMVAYVPSSCRLEICLAGGRIRGLLRLPLYQVITAAGRAPPELQTRWMSSTSSTSSSSANESDDGGPQRQATPQDSSSP